MDVALAHAQVLKTEGSVLVGVGTGPRRRSSYGRLVTKIRADGTVALSVPAYPKLLRVTS